MERDRSLRSGERQRAATLDEIEFWHKWRYMETTWYVSGKQVLDMCCGVGYGSYLMASVAREVIGIDDSQVAIDFASKHYKRDNIFYMVHDFLEVVPSSQIDVIVSFEAIEHIKDTDRVFEIFNSIKPELFIVSTPHLKCPMGGNKFHFRHYGMDELVDRFWSIGYKPKRAELLYFGGGLNNFYIGEKR